MNFSVALANLKDGLKVTRKGWNGKNQWLMLWNPQPRTEMTLPYIYLRTVDDNTVPWTASQTDILAEDWIIL